MSSLAGRDAPATAVPLTLGLAGLLALVAAAFGLMPLLIAAALVGAAWLSGVGRFEWRFVLAAVVLTILFIPIRRYTFPGSLPFALEPYRVVVALVFAGWLLAALADPQVKLRRTALDAPLLLVAVAIVGSIAANGSRVAALQTDVVKSATFFATFLLIVYFVASTVDTERAVDFLLRVMVVGGAAVALLAVIEYQTGVNVIDRVMMRLPILNSAEDTELLRSAGVRRAFASAEHPIALGAMLAMLTPIALYTAYASRRRIWWALVVLIALGVLATVSRTSILMLAAAGVLLLVLRPSEIKRLLPLALAALVLSKLIVPGSIGTLRYFFFPEEGLIAQQQSSAGSCTSAGRIADLGPSLSEFAQKPMLGYGFGTRIVTGERTNACILDNQWLATLLDMGLVGALAFLWLFSRFIRHLSREGRRDLSPRGWLPTALAGSVVAYAVGMLTFDAFGFIQVTVLMFILLGLGAAVLRARSGPRLRAA